MDLLIIYFLKMLGLKHKITTHLYLVQFQILNRQKFNLSNYLKAYNAAFGTNPANPLPAGCMPWMFCPAYGPPLDYFTGNPRALLH